MPPDLRQLHALGERIGIMLTAGEMTEIQEMMDVYLAGLDAQFGRLEQDLTLMPDSEQTQLLEQFKDMLVRVEHEISQVESELRGLSKAGRVTELYKQNAG